VDEPINERRRENIYKSENGKLTGMRSVSINTRHVDQTSCVCTVQGIFHIVLMTDESESAFEFKADLDGCMGVPRPFAFRDPVSVALLHGPGVRVAGVFHRCLDWGGRCYAHKYQKTDSESSFTPN
jgi:hypothetical protein